MLLGDETGVSALSSVMIYTKNLPHTVTDSVVISIGSLILFYILYNADGQRQHHNFVGCLQENLSANGKNINESQLSPATVLKIARAEK